MTSVSNGFFNLSAHQRPTVGDTKMSVVGVDHMGWLKCDGRALTISNYTFLFNVIGYSFGGSNGTFNLPNPQGMITGYVGSNNPRSLANHAMGDISGEEYHTLNINEMPAHKHGSVDVTGNTNGNGFTDLSGNHRHTGTTDPAGYAASLTTASDADVLRHNVADNAGNHTHTFTTDFAGTHAHIIGSTGGGAAHNNMQPTLFLGNLYIYSGKHSTYTPAVPTMNWPFTSGYYAGDNSVPSAGKNIV